MNFFIYAPSYDANNGGAIVLHRLCHIINETSQHQAYLVPFGYPIAQPFKKLRRWLRGELTKPRKFKTQPQWNTPIWRQTTIPNTKTDVAIYPEMTEGNPFKLKNVVRWLLHQPGFHTQKIEYGDNELYFKFNSAIDDFTYKNSVVSKNELKVIYYPIDIYSTGNETAERDIDCCHLIRKGTYKKFIHSESSIALDGKSHQEIAAIFKRAKRFICYDDYTAYSIFAVLCGCESVVIPDENTSIEQWYPNEQDRYGIAYGLSPEQLEWAAKTKDKVLTHILAEHDKTVERVKICLKEIEEFFR